MLPRTTRPQHAEVVIYLGKCGLVVKDCGRSTGPEVREMRVAKSTLSGTRGSRFLDLFSIYILLAFVFFIYCYSIST